MSVRTSGVDDWTLVARARQGDMNAYAELVRRYQAPIIQFCLRMVGSFQDAEEIAQDAFVRVYRHLDRLQPDARFSTLLFGIARNLALNAIRDAKRRGRGITDAIEQPAAIGDDSRRPDRAARLHEVEYLVEQAIERLSPEHREILVLREINGLDYDAIADVLGCPKGTVRSRLARAREQLRVTLTDLEGDRA